MLLVGCGSESSDGSALNVCGGAATRTLSCVVSYSPGKGSGFGENAFPNIIYGEPHGLGDHQGGTDVLSIGYEGEIILGFGVNAVLDGPGVDFIVFENAFYVGDDPTQPYAEPAEVSVSEDGASWVPFPCQSEAFPFDGCAGWRPVYANVDEGISAFDPSVAGGDAFDLAEVGVTRARYVRIIDRGTTSAAPTGGFDLDAVTIVNAETP